MKFVDGVGLGLEHGISNIGCNWGIMGWSRGWNLGPGWLSPKNWNLGFCWDSPLVWYLGLCWSRDWILGSKLGISDRSNLLRSCFLGWIGTWFVAGTFRRSAVWGIKGINGWIGLGQPGFCWVSPMDWILGWHWDLQMSWSWILTWHIFFWLELAGTGSLACILGWIGSILGLLDWFELGLELGLWLGLLDGLELELLDGFGLGWGLRLQLGLPEGLELGLELEWLDGLELGSELGLWFGLLDGFELVLVLWWLDGLELGLQLGLLDGFE